ncbi:CYC3 [Sanghuangporus weigelae]
MGQTASQPAAVASQQQASQPSGCPMHAQSSQPPSVSTPAKCPVAHNPSTSVQSIDSQRPEKCPVAHDSNVEINPLNQMPSLPQSTALGQDAALPTDRSLSSIPRPGQEGGGVWEYPSPQQFHHALLRKGMETPEEHVEMMVAIHNFLNERAWDEVLRWEKRHDEAATVELARFKGRPGELSPKARFFLLAGWLLPTRFNTEPPFDRHDWIVKRRSTGEEVRYVIDYYSAPPEPDGSPCFSLDVRPALDNFGNAKDRIAVATEEAWTTWKANQNAGGGINERRSGGTSS